MKDLIKLKNGRLKRFEELPEDVRNKIDELAALGIHVDNRKQKINASQVNIEHQVNKWIALKKSEKTKVNYRKAINDFFIFLQGIGVNPILCRAEHVDAYILELEERLKNNSIRARVSSCSSFYSLLKRYKYISDNPFHGSPLPKKEYKKSINPDHNKTIPIMSRGEYKSIIKEIERRTTMIGHRVQQINARKAARALLPAVQFMAQTGLRVGAVATVAIKGNRFSYMTKGNKSFSRKIEFETALDGRPFKDYKIITIQKSFSRITKRLQDAGIIRHNYSCHDLRHFYAVGHYKKNKDIVELKNILGHASINVTDIYLQNIGGN